MGRNSTPTTCISRRRRKSQGGNAILEFAIGWFFLWLAFSGCYEFGYAFYIYGRLEAATASAVELGSRISYDTGNPSAYTTTLQNMVLYGDESAGTSPMVSGLAASNVNVSVTTDANSMPRDVTVTVTNYTMNAFFGTFTLPKPRASALYYGQVTCSTC